MRLSETRKSALYRAVYQNVTNLRIEIAKNPDINARTLDERLVDLERTIWNDIELALNLKSDGEA